MLSDKSYRRRQFFYGILCVLGILAAIVSVVFLSIDFKTEGGPTPITLEKGQVRTFTIVFIIVELVLMFLAKHFFEKARTEEAISSIANAIEHQMCKLAETPVGLITQTMYWGVIATFLGLMTWGVWKYIIPEALVSKQGIWYFLFLVALNMIVAGFTIASLGMALRHFWRFVSKPDHDEAKQRHAQLMQIFELCPEDLQRALILIEQAERFFARQEEAQPNE